MNAFRKYAPWIIGIAMAAFIIPSTTSSFFKEKDDSKPSVKQPPKQYEPPFRMDGTLWAINDSDTTAIFRTEYANTPETIEYGMMYRQTMDKDMAIVCLYIIPYSMVSGVLAYSVRKMLIHLRP